MLEEVRNQINQIDEELVALLEKRYVCVDEVVRIKKENNIPTLDSTREETVIKRTADLVEKLDYQESIVKTFQSIMDISKEYQRSKN